MPHDAISRIPAQQHAADWIVVGADTPDAADVTRIDGQLHVGLMSCGVPEGELSLLGEGEVLWLPEDATNTLASAQCTIDQLRLMMQLGHGIAHVYAGHYRGGADPHNAVAHARAAAAWARADMATRIGTYQPELHGPKDTSEEPSDTDMALTWVAQVAAATAGELGWPQARCRALARVASIVGFAWTDAVAPVPGALGGLFSGPQLKWLLHQHERWDGAGQPLGLRGAQISEGGAILAAAQLYTTIAADWVGPDAESALHECRHQAGGRLAPYVVLALGRACARRNDPMSDVA